MLALVYLVIVFLLGDSICRRFFPFVSLPHRIATGFLSGLLIGTWLTYIFASLFGESSYPMLAGNLLFAVVAGAAIYLLNFRFSVAPQESSIDREDAEFKRADWITTGIFFLVAIVMMYGTFSMNDGNIRIANHQSSDFGSTASIMQSFAIGHNFPTEYPHFSGDKIRYHFLYYFQTGNLQYLGLSPASSTNTLSILTLLSMLVLVMTLGTVLFQSRLVGRIGAILFFFHGSLSFIPFFQKYDTLSSAWAKLSKTQDFLPSGFPYRGEEWGVWSQVVYLNQRHLASSIGILLIVFIFLAIKHRDRIEGVQTEAAHHPEAVPSEDSDPADGDDQREVELEEVTLQEQLEEQQFDATSGADAEIASVDEESSDESVDHLAVEKEEADTEPKVEPAGSTKWAERFAPFLFAGLLLGLMPLWNGAVFAAAAGVLAVMFLVLPLRREMLMIAVGSLILSLPQVSYLRTGLQPAGYSLWYFGYTVADPTFYKVLSYLAFTFGFKWIFIGIAIALGNKLQRLMMLSFTALIIMATCFQFSEELLANHKFFNVWLVLMNVPVAFGIVQLWKLIPGSGAVASKVTTVVLVFFVVIGGVLDLFPIKNSFWVEYRFQNDRLVDWVRQNTDPRAIFLSHRYVNHGILIAGRRLYYGHPYYAWGAGYPTNERDITYRKMFESQNINEFFALIKENRISYVAVDNIVRNGTDFIKKNNEKLFQAYFPVVFTDDENKYDSLKIYKVPDSLGPPDPSVALVGPSASPTPTTISNAFVGGEGAGSGQFSRPRGIAVDKKGNIYVADTGNARIQKFDSDGEFIASFGKSGTAEGEMKEPNGIALDDTGNIYVTDAFNHKLMKLEANGNILKEWKGPEPGFYGPRDIEFGPDKRLYIVDQGRVRIVRFDPSNESYSEWGGSGTGDGQFTESTGIAIGGGFILVADTGNNRIQVFDMNGVFVRKWDVPQWERYIWHYPDVLFDEVTKKVYVSNGWKKEILAFDLEGNLTESGLSPITTDELNLPSALSVWQSNKRRMLLVLNTGGFRLSQFEIASTTGTNEKKSDAQRK